MQANVEKHSHMVHRIFSHTLRRALNATGGAGEAATGKARKIR